VERFWDYENEDDDDDDDPSIPRALIPAADYDAFICGDCLIRSPMLLNYAGSEGCRMVVRDGGGDWFVWAGGPLPKSDTSKDAMDSLHTDDKDDTPVTNSATIGQKRTLEQMDASSSSEGPAKKPKLDTVSCSAPIPHPNIQVLLERIKIQKGPYMEGEGLHGGGDIFFTPGWRERWCKCEQVCSLVFFAILILS
jgi:E3 ubiquitin-protein ligase UBR7